MQVRVGICKGGSDELRTRNPATPESFRLSGFSPESCADEDRSMKFHNLPLVLAPEPPISLFISHISMRGSRTLGFQL